MNELNPSEKESALFMSLLFSLFQNAMMGLGKIAGPDGKIERDLENASASIDMLEMLKNKCKMSKEESDMLNTMLSDLKLNSVDEKSKDKSPIITL